MNEALVAAVCQVLDNFAPGWARRIDLAKLRMICPQSCVLAQAFGGGKHLHSEAYDFIVSLIAGHMPAGSRSYDTQTAFANFDLVWKAEIALRQERGF